ncbi:Glyoxalase/bleomycin resistance protein/dioxygenase [Beutenbergia cavernae DSM 12333]|uniref:Glyoxalase/bleomycin resistance protein/dioxygenase n=1 Tax=Beutenbergia cavernae (strain ATCC BAA-8 / DSM 12333 / CCUG 43141 / JCM 11478 / NBRC 16432 / NCIMB 13614 / HKI 0122) TaxID=471853 RepID=C5BVX8_BEUC1|nr:VOC family protein [Beutenbergia cavernae]ACQ80579.1 Glyoxalase/bleomycin resistance protein/dioxygenase [Beutenbergia cavernae DSM 12333]
MKLTSSYPVLMSADVPAAATFFRDTFGFTDRFTSDWYVSLAHGSFELAVLDHRHATIPEGYRDAPAAGVLLNLEVEDVDALYAELAGREGIDVVLPLRSEDFGQRHFIVAGPDRVLVDVITPIPFAGEFAEAPA